MPSSRVLRSQRLHRIHHGVYALVQFELLQPSGRLMAAVLACGPGAALSHHAAGAFQDLLESHRTLTDVTVPSRTGRRRAGIRDGRRDQRAAAAGFQTVRVTSRQLIGERDRLSRAVRAIVTQAARTRTAARVSARG